MPGDPTITQVIDFIINFKGEMMAGNQASVMSKPDFIRYNVKPHDNPPSTVYFNKVKAWMQHKMSSQVKQWETIYGEKRWWQMVFEEMSEYTFGFEGNQAEFIYIKYRKVLS